MKARGLDWTVATPLRTSPRQETLVVLDAWASSPAVVYSAIRPIGVRYFALRRNRLPIQWSFLAMRPSQVCPGMGQQ
jgi:hypothetical protein